MRVAWGVVRQTIVFIVPRRTRQDAKIQVGFGESKMNCFACKYEGPKLKPSVSRGTCGKSWLQRSAPRSIFEVQKGHPDFKNVWFSYGNTMNFKDFHVENASPRGRWGQAEKVPHPYYSYYDLLERTALRVTFHSAYVSNWGFACAKIWPL